MQHACTHALRNSRRWTLPSVSRHSLLSLQRTRDRRRIGKVKWETLTWSTDEPQYRPIQWEGKIHKMPLNQSEHHLFPSITSWYSFLFSTFLDALVSRNSALWVNQSQEWTGFTTTTFCKEQKEAKCPSSVSPETCPACSPAWFSRPGWVAHSLTRPSTQQLQQHTVHEPDVFYFWKLSLSQVVMHSN